MLGFFIFNPKCLALTYSCSKATIGADELNCSVRDGKRCILIARNTKHSRLNKKLTGSLDYARDTQLLIRD